ncbi:cation:proton antiporter [Sporosarcina globispora]|uniref:Cation:proton antiporter n=1 Tax=Sporosarcina globispora TaxID=1459 RepID=A0A0M0GAH2_SPOGL|nr:monovalent cation/H(+) antiporter subunit G [Sporosarcina globispora]KON86502.1 cation:proton antiporter [Sporosarcina globispora]
MTEIANVFIIVFILLGAFFILVAAFGVIRLPDVYTRNHAASKSATLGVLCVLLGTLLFFYFKDGYFNSRVVLGIIFIFLTSPIAGHLIGRAAYNSGVKLWDKSIRDDLKNVSKAKDTAGKGQ